jgi:hypothetical protein
MIDENFFQVLFNNFFKENEGYSYFDLFDNKELLYGEIPFLEWKKIIEFFKCSKGNNFIDLGSGIGRVVMQSYFLYDYKKFVGVELQKTKHQKAISVQEEFSKLNLKDDVAISLKNKELLFINDNLFNIDLANFDVVLLSHPFCEEDRYLELEQKFLKELPDGAKIISLIRSLKNENFKKIASKDFYFSWGNSTVHLFQR